jgi:hypothetical protein
MMPKAKSKKEKIEARHSSAHLYSTLLAEAGGSRIRSQTGLFSKSLSQKQQQQKDKFDLIGPQ